MEHLWTDDAIDKAVSARMIYTDQGGCVRAYDARHLMRQIRDALQAPQGVDVPDDVLRASISAIGYMLMDDLMGNLTLNDAFRDTLSASLDWLKAQRPDAGQEDDNE